MSTLFQNLLTTVQPQVALNAVAAGTSTQTTSAIDTQGYDGVLIVLMLGAVTSTGVPAMKVQQSSDDASTDDYTDIAGSLQTGDDTIGTKFIAIEIFKPQKRYLKAVVTRTTANVVINNVLVFLYNPTFGPPALHSTGAFKKFLNSPAEGTA